MNRPACPVNNYQRDGRFAGTGRVADGSVNFYPNDRATEGSPAPVSGPAEPPLPTEDEAAVGWYDTRGENHREGKISLVTLRERLNFLTPPKKE